MKENISGKSVGLGSVVWCMQIINTCDSCVLNHLSPCCNVPR